MNHWVTKTPPNQTIKDMQTIEDASEKYEMHGYKMTLIEGHQATRAMEEMNLAYEEWIRAWLNDERQVFSATLQSTRLDVTTIKATLLLKRDAKAFYSALCAQMRINLEKANINKLPVLVGIPDLRLAQQKPQTELDFAQLGFIHFYLLLAIPRIPKSKDRSPNTDVTSLRSFFSECSKSSALHISPVERVLRLTGKSRRSQLNYQIRDEDGVLLLLQRA